MENLSFNYCSCPTLTGIDSTYGECGACADSPSGKRISKTVNDITMYTICFDPTMDIDQNGNIIARYVQNPNVLDEPISIEIAGGKYYYLFDGLGSVTGLTDTGGSLVSTYSYDAFGNILSETGDATLNAINPYRFTSRIYDKESGLYYYRARYYDSKTGRFTQKDPLRSELREGKNLYVYVGNNPVNMVDPSGLWNIVPLRYKVCVWWKCWYVTYGYQIRLERSETGVLCSLEGGVVAFLTLVPLGIYGGTAGLAAAILITGYVTAICYVHGYGYRVALNWYPVTPGILWVVSW